MEFQFFLLILVISVLQTSFGASIIDNVLRGALQHHLPQSHFSDPINLDPEKGNASNFGSQLKTHLTKSPASSRFHRPVEWLTTRGNSESIFDAYEQDPLYFGCTTRYDKRGKRYRKFCRQRKFVGAGIDWYATRKADPREDREAVEKGRSNNGRGIAEDAKVNSAIKTIYLVKGTPKQASPSATK